MFYAKTLAKMLQNIFSRMVTRKTKHLQKCFRTVDFLRVCYGRKIFYFTSNHLLSSTCVRHAKTFLQMFCKCSANVLIISHVTTVLVTQTHQRCDHSRRRSHQASCLTWGCASPAAPEESVYATRRPRHTNTRAPACLTSSPMTISHVS